MIVSCILLSPSHSLEIQAEKSPHKRLFIVRLLRSFIHFSLWHVVSPEVKKVCKKKKGCFSMHLEPGNIKNHIY